jgi:hypothetical protein
MKTRKPDKKHIYDIKENGKNATGAPTKYNPEYCQSIVKYFKDAPVWQEIQDSSTSDIKGGSRHSKKIPARMPTFGQYASNIGVNGDTLVEWEKEHKDFSAAYNEAKRLQQEWLIEVGMSGECPPASFIFIAKNVTDMKDKTEVDMSLKTFEHYKSEKDAFNK